MMVPLSEEYALKVIGERARNKPAGTYVAARVGKKNEGHTEALFFLEHADDGLFERVEADGPDSEKSCTQTDSHMLADEVRQREACGTSP